MGVPSVAPLTLSFVPFVMVREPVTEAEPSGPPEVMSMPTPSALVLASAKVMSKIHGKTPSPLGRSENLT